MSGDSAESLLWQALSLSRGLIHQLDELELEMGDGAARPLIEPLNRIDERIFFALFAFVPGMYGEDEKHAIARDRYFNERFGTLPDSLGLTGTPAERIELLLQEMARRIGGATIRLETADGEEGEFEAIDQLELALDAVSELRTTLRRITQHVG